MTSVSDIKIDLITAGAVSLRGIGGPAASIAQLVFELQKKYRHPQISDIYEDIEALDEPTVGVAVVDQTAKLDTSLGVTPVAEAVGLNVEDPNTSPVQWCPFILTQREAQLVATLAETLVARRPVVDSCSQPRVSHHIDGFAVEDRTKSMSGNIRASCKHHTS